MLSNKVRYAIKAMVALARKYGQGPVLIADLAEQERLPKKFLELILLELRNGGLLESKKGKGGGYSLNRTPDLISVGNVMRVVDGPLAPLPCVSQTAYKRCEECVDEVACGLRMVMKQVRDETASILDGTSLSDVIAREDAAVRTAQGAMYHI
jgi:Rrf2 family protein